MTDTDIDDFLVAVEEKESAAVKLALEAATALHEALAAKRRLAVPPLLETRPAVNELEARVAAGRRGKASRIFPGQGQEATAEVPSGDRSVAIRRADAPKNKPPSLVPAQ